MTHVITLTPDEETVLDAAARASGRPTTDFLHSLILASLHTTQGNPAVERDEVAVRRRMVERWDAIDAEEDRAAAGTNALEKAAA